jgi:hypothetical protein
MGIEASPGFICCILVNLGHEMKQTAGNSTYFWALESEYEAKVVIISFLALAIL